MNSILQVLRYTPGFLETLAQLFQDIVASEKIKRKQKNSDETEVSIDSSVHCINRKKLDNVLITGLCKILHALFLQLLKCHF